MEGEPSCVSAHDFDDHDSVMGGCGGVDAVECFGCDCDCGLEAEGDV